MAPLLKKMPSSLKIICVIPKKNWFAAPKFFANYQLEIAVTSRT